MHELAGALFSNECLSPDTPFLKCAIEASDFQSSAFSQAEITACY